MAMKELIHDGAVFGANAANRTQLLFLVSDSHEEPDQDEGKEEEDEPHIGLSRG